MANNVNRKRPHNNTYWVTDNFLAGEYPGAYTESEAANRIRAYLDIGVSYFIDLTSETDGLRPYQHILEMESKGQVIYKRMPVPDFGVPKPEFMDEILDLVETALSDGHVVYVHCWGGVGRTGTVVGCYLRRRGLNGQDALDELGRRFAAMEKANRGRISPETDEQVRFIRNYQHMKDKHK